MADVKSGLYSRDATTTDGSARGCRKLPDIVWLESAARAQHGRHNERVLHLPLGSHKRSLGKTAFRKRSRSTRCIVSAKMVDSYAGCRRRRRSFLHLVRIFLKALMPRGVWLHLLPESILDVSEQQVGGNDQNIEQFCGDTLHRFLPYFIGVAGRSSLVLAISSRITVSACKFFMR